MMTTGDLIKLLINKMLEKHGVDFDFVKANDKVNGEWWYSYYTWTTQESEEFKAWAIELMRKEMKWSKKLATLKYSGFDLEFGLRIVDTAAEPL